MKVQDKGVAVGRDILTLDQFSPPNRSNNSAGGTSMHELLNKGNSTNHIEVGFTQSLLIKELRLFPWFL